MSQNNSEIENDLLKLLKLLSKSESFSVEINTPMGPDWVNAIKSPEYEVNYLMKKHFPEELI